MSKIKTYLGLDIGGTKSAAIIGTSAGGIVERVEWPSNAKQGCELMLNGIIENAKKIKVYLFQIYFLSFYLFYFIFVINSFFIMPIAIII